MFQLAGSAVQHEQFAGIATVRRNLRDEVGRQLVMEIRGSEHKCKVIRRFGERKREVKAVNNVCISCEQENQEKND